jgi:hypothetical protein
VNALSVPSLPTASARRASTVMRTAFFLFIVYSTPGCD